MDRVKKQRIWEIDAFRGLCLFFVFAAHLIYDMNDTFGRQWQIGALFEALFQYGGAVFIVVSGLSATLGSRSFRRGLIVLGCGMLITLVTVLMIAMGAIGSQDIIQFGVLHLIGTCMIVYPFLKKLPTFLLAILGAAMLGVGYWFLSFRIAAPASTFDIRNLLYVFGLRTEAFYAGDYFPILPNMGWFLLGIVLGRLVYREKRSLLPNFPADFFLIRALRFVGRHSLLFYLVHQPVFFAVFYLIQLLSSH